jgi:predicted DNA-binding ribbon-helix-helix protein
MAIRLLLFALGLACATGPAFAWVYPEHRDIAVLGVESLDPERKALFDRLWAEARIDHEKRLCEQGADAAQGVTPECIDWAALSAIAGDHSCSSKQLIDTVTTSDSVLAVADVAAQLKVDLLRISKTPSVASRADGGGLISDLRGQIESEAVRAERINALRIADVRLQRADPEYATRAGSNNAHFLLARPEVDFTGRQYMEATLKAGSEINAVGVWAGIT